MAEEKTRKGRPKRLVEMREVEALMLKALLRIGFKKAEVSKLTFLSIYRYKLDEFIEANQDLKILMKLKKKDDEERLAAELAEINASREIMSDNNVDIGSFKNNKLKIAEEAFDCLMMEIANREGEPKEQKVQFENFQKMIEALGGGNLNGTVKVKDLEEGVYYVKKEDTLVPVTSLRDVILDKDAD